MGQAGRAGEGGIDIELFRSGREAVLAQLYLAYRAILRRDAGRYAGADEAEAVVHEVFVELLRNAQLRGRFGGGSLPAWLRHITRLKALEHARRRRELPGESPFKLTSPSHEGLVTAREFVIKFMEACVPERQRQFFALRFLAQHTQVELSSRLGVPRSTLEGWEQRLTEKLREFIVDGVAK